MPIKNPIICPGVLPKNIASGPFVVSVQEVVSGAITTGTVDVALTTSVNTNYASIVWGGTYSGNGRCDYIMPRVHLTSSTNARFTVAGPFPAVTNAVCYVIEWSPTYVNSVQRSTVSVTTTSANATLGTAVDLSYAACFYNGHTTTVTSATPEVSSMYGSVALTGTTTVTGYLGSGQATIGFSVVDFKSSALASTVQRFATGIASGGSSTTQAITSTGTPWLVFGGVDGTGGAADYGEATVAGITRTASNTVTIYRNAHANGGTSNIRWEVLNFNTALVNALDYNKSLSITSGATTSDGSLTSRTDTVTSYLGTWKTDSTYPGSLRPDRHHFWLRKTSDTAVELRRSDSSSLTYDGVGSFERIKFN